MEIPLETEIPIPIPVLLVPPMMIGEIEVVCCGAEGAGAGAVRISCCNRSFTFSSISSKFSFELCTQMFYHAHFSCKFAPRQMTSESFLTSE